MRQKLNHLIQSFRNELMAGAEMSVCLDRHFQFLAHPLDGDINETTSNVLIKNKAMKSARKHRTRAQATMASALRLDVDVPIEKIIPLLPVGDQSLVIALVRAGRELRAQIMLMFRQNQALLGAALAGVRHFLDNIFPGCFDKAESTGVPKTAPIFIRVADMIPPAVFDVEITMRKPAPFHFMASEEPQGARSTGSLSISGHRAQCHQQLSYQLSLRAAPL